MEPREKSFIEYDTELTGFGVRVTPAGSKSYIVEYRPGARGRGVSKRRVTIGPVHIFTPDQARHAARDILASVRLGSDPAADQARRRGTLTVKELGEQFLTEGTTTKKENTTTLYRIYFNKHIVPEIGTHKIDAVTRAMVAKLHRKIGASAPATANRVLVCFSGAISWALKTGLLPDDHRNPCKGIERYKESAKERFLSSEELQRLGASLQLAESEGLPWEPDPAKAAKHAPREENRRIIFAPHITAAIRLLLFTGCRLREILHLRWQDVDFERGMLILPDSKTGRKPVILSAPALAVLNSLKRVGEYVVPGDDLKKPRHDLKKPWGRISAHAGLDGVRLHDLRHTFASTAAAGGASLPIIGKLLGHAQPTTTQRYAHLADDPLRAVADRVGAQVAAALGGAPAAEVVPIRKAKS